MSTGMGVAKNAFLLMAATTGQKIVSFLAFYLVSDVLGPRQIGAYAYAISITSIFVVAADLGTTQVVIRSIAGNRENARRLLGAAFRLKVLLIPLSIALSIGYTWMFGASQVVWMTVLIACGVMAADSVHLLFYGVLRGRQHLRVEAMGMFIGQVLTAVAAVLAAWSGFGPVGLAAALLIGSVWNVVWVAFHVKTMEIGPLEPGREDREELMKQALPFALAGLSVKVYSYVDSLCLRFFHGETSVGLYAVAYKLTYALQFLPLAFTAALYPALASSYAIRDEVEVRRTFCASLRLMAAFGFPLSAGLSALAPKIIPFMYRQEYAGSILPLEVLPWVLLPIFLDFPIGALLNAMHRASLKTVAMVVTMAVNVILNLWLVPVYGPVGAAWAGVCSFWGLYAIGAWFTREQAGGIGIFLDLTARALVAASVSWFAWHEIAAPMHVVPAGIFGAAVAVLMAFVTGLMTVQDVAAVIAQVRPTWAKIADLHD